jgi:IS5 family transposase
MRVSSPPPTKQRRKKWASRVAVPSQNTRSPQRRQRQKQRSFKELERWRTGCEGRISVLKQRHGLNRSRYKGTAGMKRRVGCGVIADNVINLGRTLAASLKT